MRWRLQGMSTKQDCWSKVKLNLGILHRIGFQWIRLPLKRTLVQGHTKLWGGQPPPLCKPVGHSLTLWSGLWWWCGRHGLGSGRIRDRRDTGNDSFLCIRFILILGITAASMQTSGFSKVYLFLPAKSSTLKKRDQRGSRLIDNCIMAPFKRTGILLRWARGSNYKPLVMLSAYFHMCFIVSWAKATAPTHSYCTHGRSNDIYTYGKNKGPGTVPLCLHMERLLKGDNVQHIFVRLSPMSV